MKKHPPHQFRKAQQGAVLVVSLLILLILTILGVSSMQSSTLEEKMAGNSRDRNVGFQSAEAAVRAAEIYIESLVTTGGFTDTNGLYSSIGTEPDPFATGTGTTWNTASKYRAATAPGGSAGAQYFISRAGTINDTAPGQNLEIPTTTVTDITIFRITSRGQGATAEGSEVMLRSHYGRKM